MLHRALCLSYPAVCLQHMSAVVTWLTSHPEVTWVDVARQTKLHDLYSAASMQVSLEHMQARDTARAHVRRAHM